MESLLAGEMVEHFAWDHWGKVRLEGDTFKEEVWQWNAPVETIEAASLEALVGLVNGKYGSA